METREPPYLKTTHAVCRRLCSLVFKNVLDARRHNFADRATVRWISLRGGARRNISVGDHSNKPVIFTDRKRTAVNLRHQGGCLFNRIVRGCDQDIPTHNFVNLHVTPLFHRQMALNQSAQFDLFFEGAAKKADSTSTFDEAAIGTML